MTDEENEAVARSHRLLRCSGDNPKAESSKG